MVIRNILRNSLNPRYLPEILRKVATRPRFGFSERDDAERWAWDKAVPLSLWASSIDEALWNETVVFATQFRTRAAKTLKPLTDRGIDLGGGGSIELLYFLTRFCRPKIVLETGVAAGWSSFSILTALARNGTGELRSSDFPYFRMNEPEQHIGILVPDDLRGQWSIEIDGDRKNIPKLLSDGATVDLVHYDSDKSRPGREWFANYVERRLSSHGILVWDDIADNLVFRERAQKAHQYVVLNTPDGLVGLELQTDVLTMP